MRFQLKSAMPAVAAALTLTFAGAAFAQTAPETLEANLNSLNNSGATGTAYVALDTANNELTVIIAAEGLIPNQAHPQHIHGKQDKSNATCPTLAQDSASGEENDNQISVAEGQATYGPIMLPLKNDDGNFPSADNDGNLTFRHTYTLGTNGTPTAAELSPLENRHVVLHGLTVNGQYIPTRPVACGQLAPRPQQDGT